MLAASVLAFVLGVLSAPFLRETGGFEALSADAAPHQAAAETSQERVRVINSDTWLTTNAMFENGMWNAEDPGKPSFALWMNYLGTIPSEDALGGAGFWVRAPRCGTAFQPFSQRCGWNLALVTTQEKSVIVGGNTIELDGNGPAPFGRLTNGNDHGSRYVGVASNVFGDFSGVDVATKPSWLAAINVSRDVYEIRRLDPFAGNDRTMRFRTLFALNGAGDLSALGSVSAGRAEFRDGVRSEAGRFGRVEQVPEHRWAARGALLRGRFSFTFRPAFRHAPVCVATSEGAGRAVLHVASSASTCVVTSSEKEDRATVNVIVVGDPD
jgi:hypothetical protein